ncbi:MAG: substrate-binding domain-containing protein [Verrucomicrobia bacterium]|nr:substrate-binding domain-containing protein [Verrucomicrobiota bacterium]
MISRIVVATSDVFVRRLTPALASFVRDEREFRILDIHRPLPELRDLIRKSRPSVIITEWWPRVTDMIVKLGCPTVIADTDTIFPGCVSINVDDHKVGEVAAEFFLNAGYRNFGCMYLESPYALERLRGFRGVLAKRGFQVQAFKQGELGKLRYMESWSRPGDALRAWLRSLDKPIGIFAAHDPLGRMLCGAAVEEGLQLPEQIAVVGANNDELVCGLCYPPLSSVAIPWHRIGALAGKWAQLLIEGAAAPKSPLHVSPGPVVIRQSTTLSAINDPELRRILQYLRDHHRGAMSIQTMCKELRVSRRGIERKFSTQLGSSPLAMLRRIRTETASRLLIDTDLPMAQIAERSGFGDAEQFSVSFRKQSGMSPSAFRRSARNKPGGEILSRKSAATPWRY